MPTVWRHAPDPPSKAPRQMKLPSGQRARKRALSRPAASALLDLSWEMPAKPPFDGSNPFAASKLSLYLFDADAAVVEALRAFGGGRFAFALLV